MDGSLPGPVVLADTVVLVEGESDRVAVEELARLYGPDLAARSVAVVAMGGVTNIAAHLGRYGPTVRGARLVGLVDAGEAHHVRTALARAGMGNGSRTDLAAYGFGVCDADLEDELIRALGAERVLEVVRAQGHGRSFDRLRQQPAHRDRTLAQQLHRFFGSGSGRKVTYPPILVRSLTPATVPAPLAELLSRLA